MLTPQPLYIQPSPPILRPYYEIKKYIENHNKELIKQIKDKVQSYKICTIINSNARPY